MASKIPPPYEVKHNNVSKDRIAAATANNAAMSGRTQYESDTKLFRYSAWTPVWDKQLNEKVFTERTELVLHWFDLWTDAQREAFLRSVIKNCKQPQLTYLMDWAVPQVTYHRWDFTALLPRYLTLYLFSFFDQKTLAKIARVSWQWKNIVDQDVLWRPPCIRRKWFLPYTPQQSDIGVWKRFYRLNRLARKKNKNLDNVELLGKHTTIAPDVLIALMDVHKFIDLPELLSEMRPPTVVGSDQNQTASSLTSLSSSESATPVVSPGTPGTPVRGRISSIVTVPVVAPGTPTMQRGLSFGNLPSHGAGVVARLRRPDSLTVPGSPGVSRAKNAANQRLSSPNMSANRGGKLYDGRSPNMAANRAAMADCRSPNMAANRAAMADGRSTNMAANRFAAIASDVATPPGSPIPGGLAGPKALDNFAEWSECFALFAAYRARYYPDLAVPLLMYLRSVAMRAQRYRREAWLQYDRAFRADVAAYPSLFKWDLPNPKRDSAYLTSKQYLILPQCYNCNRRGHLMADCPRRRRQLLQDAQMNARDPLPESAATSSTGSEESLADRNGVDSP